MLLTSWLKSLKNTARNSSQKRQSRRSHRSLSTYSEIESLETRTLLSGVGAATDALTDHIHRAPDASEAVSSLIASDWAEPNDTTSSPHPLGFLSGQQVFQPLSIHSATDRDLFTFEIGPGATDAHFVRIDFDHGEGDLELVLSDSLLNVKGISHGTGDREQISLAGLPAGQYVVAVVGFSEATNPEYSLNIVTPHGLSPDWAEPNNDGFHDLGEINGRRTFDPLSIHESEDFDFFQFAISEPAGAEHFVRIEFDHSLGDLDLAIIDSESQVVGVARGVGNREEVSLAGVPAGRYYMLVAGSDDATNPHYELTINAPEIRSADRFETNDTRVTASNLGTIEGRHHEANLSIHEAGDEDWFRFTTTATATVSHFVRIDFAHSHGDLDLELYDDAGTRISRSIGVTDGEVLSLSDLPAGEYSVRVHGFWGSTNSEYALTVETPRPAGSDWAEAHGGKTNNDTREDAYSLGSVDGSWSHNQPLAIHTPGDADWFRFELTDDAVAGHLVAVEFAHALGDLDVRLWDDDGILLRRSAGVTNRELLALAGLPSGVYYVEVYGYAGATNPSYFLEIAAPGGQSAGDDFEPNGPNSPTDLGPVSGARVLGIEDDGRLSVHSDRDVDWFRFELTSTGHDENVVGILFNHDEGDLDLELYSNPQGTPIAQSRGVRNGEAISLAGRPAGVYYARVYGHQAANPSYLFAVNGPEDSAADIYETSDNGFGSAGRSDNNTRSDATDLGTAEGVRTLDGLSIHQPGGEDWYRFSTVSAATSEHSVQIEFDHDEGDLDIELYDDNGALLGTSFGIGNVERLRPADLPAGDYFIRVSGYDGAVNSQYTLTISAPQPTSGGGIEPGGTPAAAFDLGLVAGPRVVGDLENPLAITGSPADVDYFRFELGATGTADDFAALIYDVTAGELRLDLRNAANQVVSVGRGTGNASRLSLSGVAAGTYYLRVEGVSGATNPFYGLVMNGPETGISGDRAEPNDSRRTPRDLREISGTHIVSNLSIHEGDRDWFRFTTLDPGTRADFVAIDFNHLDGDLDLSVYREDGSLVGFSAGVSNRERVSLENEPPGTYLVEIRGYGGATHPEYALTINTPQRQSSGVGGQTSVRGDWAESNNEVEAAFDLRQLQGTQSFANLSIHDPNDVDYFQFTMVDDGVEEQFVGIAFDHSQGDLDLRLLDDDGDEIDRSVGVGNFERISLANRPAGTYVVEVTGYGDAWNPNYALIVDAPVSGQSGDLAESNDARSQAYSLGRVNGTVTVPLLSVHESGNDDWFRFETIARGREGHGVAIDFDDDAGDLDLVLYDANGQVVDRSRGIADREQVSLTNEPAGVYYVRIYGYNGATNPGYTLSINAPVQLAADRISRTHANSSREQAFDLNQVSGVQMIPGLSIDQPSGNDWFRFEIMNRATDSHNVGINFHQADGDLDLELMLPNGQVRRANSTTNNEILSLDGLSEGEYYLRVLNPDGHTNPNYSLWINAPQNPFSDWTESPGTSGLDGYFDLRTGISGGGQLFDSTNLSDPTPVHFATSTALSQSFSGLFASSSTPSSSLSIGTGNPFGGQQFYPGAVAQGLAQSSGAGGGQFRRLNANAGFGLPQTLLTSGNLTGTQLNDLLSPLLPGGTSGFLRSFTGNVGILSALGNSRLGGGILSASLAPLTRGVDPVAAADSLIGGNLFSNSQFESGIYGSLARDLNRRAQGLPPAPSSSRSNNASLGLQFASQLAGNYFQRDLNIIRGAQQRGVFGGVPQSIGFAPSPLSPPQPNFGSINLRNTGGFGTNYSPNFGSNLLAGTGLGPSFGSPAFNFLSRSGFLRFPGHYAVQTDAAGLAGSTSGQMLVQAPASETATLPGHEQTNVSSGLQAVGFVGNLSIHAPDDVDRFRIELPGTGSANHFVGIEFDHTLGDLTLELLDFEGRVIFESSGTGNLEQLSLAGIPAGEYIVQVSGVDGATNPNYALLTSLPQHTDPRGDSIDQDAHNETKATAHDLRIVEGTRALSQLSIHDAHDQDWFRFEITSPAVEGHFARLAFDHAAGDLDLRLENETGSFVRVSDGTQDIEQVDLSGLAPGVYFLGVSGHAGATNPEYTLTLQAPNASEAADRLEPNGDFATGEVTVVNSPTARFQGLTIHHPEDRSHDVDEFQFTTTAAGTAAHSISMHLENAAGNLDLVLLHEDGTSTGRISQTGEDAEFLSLEGLPEGTYVLRAQGREARIANRYDLAFDLPPLADSPSTDAWTVMVYMTVDNLERHAFQDLNELEMAAAELPGSVNFVVLVDQSSALVAGADGGMREAYRFETGGGMQSAWGHLGVGIVRPDRDPNRIATEFLRPDQIVGRFPGSAADWNTGNPQTLVEFVRWTTETAPADRYALMSWSAGLGLGGTNADPEDSGDGLALSEWRQALQSLQQSGVAIDLVALDADRMALAEFAHELSGLTEVFVASQGAVAGSGHDYRTAFSSLASNPYGTSPGAVAAGLVHSYGFQNIGRSQTDTYSAVELQQFGTFTTALRAFVTEVLATASTETWRELRNALHGVRFSNSPEGGVRDLGQFLRNASEQATSASIRAKARTALEALDEIVSSHTNGFQGAQGLSIYLPGQPSGSTFNQQLNAYRAAHASFLSATRWDEFLSGMPSSGEMTADADWTGDNTMPARAFPLHAIAGRGHVIDGLNVGPAPASGAAEEWFRFTLSQSAGATHRIAAVGESGVDLDLAVYRTRAGRLDLVAGTEEGDGGMDLSLNGLAAGEYFLRVRTRSTGAPVAYQLHIDAPEPNGDWLAGNNRSEKARRLGTISSDMMLSGLMIQQGTIDWYQFATPRASVDTQGHIRITTPQPAVVRLELYHMDVNGAWNRIAETAGLREAVLPYAVGGSEAYRLRVTTDAPGALVNYRLEFLSQASAELASVPTLSGPAGSASDPRPVFQWTPTAGADHYDLWGNDLTTGQSGVIRETRVAGNVFRPAHNLAVGHRYIWTVRPINGQGTPGAWAPHQTFTVQAAPVPTIAGPSGTVGSLRPTFEWSATGADHYDLWVNNLTTGQSGVIRNVNVRDHRFNPTFDFQPGHSYLWTVRGIASDGTASHWAPHVRMTVAAPLAASIPGGPTGTVADAAPIFTWSPVPGADHYDLWVNDLTTGEIGVIRNTHIPEASYIHPVPLIDGHSYIWTVRAVNGDGSPGRWSSHRTFRMDIVPAAASIDGPVASSSTALPIFEWTPIAGAHHYDLWVNNLTTGESGVIREQNVTVHRFQPATPLTDGHTYIWTVRALAEDGTPGPWAPHRTFVVNVGLSTPTLIGPSGTVLGGAQAFEWSAVSGAQRYDLWVNDLTTGQSGVIRNQNVTTNSFRPSTPLAAGHRYIWTVRAIAADGTAGDWASHQAFTVGAGLVVPSPVGPIGTVAGGDQVFQWSAVSGAQRYDLWVNDLTTGQSGVIRNTNVTANSFRPSTPLTTGHRYIWTVRAIAADGTASAWAGHQTFTVAAGLQTPALFGPTGTVGTTAPRFEWSAVGGAHHYDVWVNDRTTGQSGVIRMNVSGTSFTPGPLAVGHSYIWTVRAIAADGTASAWGAHRTFTIAASSNVSNVANLAADDASALSLLGTSNETLEGIDDVFSDWEPLVG